MDLTLYVDLRCLQDVNYRVRGIGHHVAALLRARSKSALANCRTIGLVDPKWPTLPVQCASLVDDVTFSVNPCYDGKALSIFIDGTPMTHDPRFSLRFLGQPGFLSSAVVYDFIPLDWPGYLPTVATRIEYVAKLARLRKFDLFFPISGYTAWRLSQLLGVPPHRVWNTGASVRQPFYELAGNGTKVPKLASGRDDPYFLVVIADDPRKNPQVVIEAVRRLNLLYSKRIALKVVGHYHTLYKSRLLKLAGHAEGAGFLEFFPEISDAELVALYRGALATVASSHIEGFSLPVVEAAVCGCPVVASSCAAHLELIEQPEALFQSNDAVTLADKLEALLNDPGLRQKLVLSQAHLASKFHEHEVAGRFWGGIETAVQTQTKKVSSVRRSKPRFAFMSPYPPDPSEAAFHTAMTMQEGVRSFESDLYTDTARPLVFQNSLHDAGRVTAAPLLKGKYNAVISVLGNSQSYTKTFEFFERYGGPCILHDVRLTQAYFERLGPAEFLDLATTLLRRPVALEEVNRWLQDIDPPSLFADRIVERASHVIVHTLTQQALLKEYYGVDAHVATSCPSLFFADDELTCPSKQAARKRLGIPESSFLISTFGAATRGNGMDACILAVDFLRSWNMPAKLVFIGEAVSERGEMDRISDLYRVSDHIHTRTVPGTSEVYRDYLIASDAAIQLRSYSFGAASMDLSNSISAMLPCVATDDMAVSSDAPSYVSRVPDHFSPLHVAEQLALLWESAQERSVFKEEHAGYMKTHNFDYYGSRLMEILGQA